MHKRRIKVKIIQNDTYTITDTKTNEIIDFSYAKFVNI